MARRPPDGWHSNRVITIAIYRYISPLSGSVSSAVNTRGPFFFAASSQRLDVEQEGVAIKEAFEPEHQFRDAAGAIGFEVTPEAMIGFPAPPGP